MGTILQSLSTRREGLLLYESFESVNFMADQAWQLVHGTPTITDSVAKQGLFSLVMDSSYPAITKKFNAPFGYSTVWFYDDATQTASTFQPFVQWTNSANGKVYGLGVDNATSTGFYCLLEPFLGNVATTIPRSTGWHRFTMYDVPPPAPMGVYTLNLLVDNVNVIGVTSATNNSPDTITVGAANYASTAFGWFDWVQVLQDYFLTCYGVETGQFFQAVLNSGGTIINSLSQESGGIAQIDVSTVDFPAQGYVCIQQPPYGDVLFYQSDLFNLFGGDVYKLNLYRFGRRPSTLMIQPMGSRNDIRAVGGPKQSVFFYDQDHVTLTFRGLDEAQKNELLRWWITAKRGETFSVAVEEDNIYLDFTQFPVTAFPTGQLILSSPATSPGQVLVAQSTDGEIKENVKVASVVLDPNTGFYTASLEHPQAEAVQADLQVRALYFWPFAATMDKNLNVTLESVQTKRWMVSLNFEELIQQQDWISFLKQL